MTERSKGKGPKHDKAHGIMALEKPNPWRTWGQDSGENQTKLSKIMSVECKFFIIYLFIYLFQLNANLYTEIVYQSFVCSYSWSWENVNSTGSPRTGRSTLAPWSPCGRTRGMILSPRMLLTKWLLYYWSVISKLLCLFGFEFKKINKEKIYLSILKVNHNFRKIVYFAHNVLYIKII